MTITHLSRFHLRAAKKQTRISDLSLDNIFSKLILVLWISLLEVEFNILITNPHFPNSFQNDENISKKSTDKKWLKLIEYFFKKKYLGKKDKALTITNLSHTNFHRYQTLKEIISNDLSLFVELRNRIAHGQWAVAFNADGFKKNQDLTTHIWKLTKKEMMLLRSLVMNLPIIARLLTISKEAFEKEYDKYINRIIRAKGAADLKYEWILKKK